MEVSRANPGVCWDGKASHRQLQNYTKKDGWTWQSTLCAMGELLTATKEIPAISQKSRYDLAMLHPALKLVTLSSRQETIQRKQARETIVTKEYFCAPGDNGQFYLFIYFNCDREEVWQRLWDEDSFQTVHLQNVQNKQLGITRVLSSPLPSRRQQTDWKSTLKILTSCCQCCPNTAVCKSPRLQPPLWVMLVKMPLNFLFTQFFRGY